MKKCVIFYFSGTGNTKWVADRIKKCLEAAEIDTRTVSIDTLDDKKAAWHLKSADIVGFGYPIYGSDLPEPMKQFIDALPKVNYERPAFVFCTQIIFSGDGAWVYKKQIAEKALNITQTAHINMPNNLSTGRILFKAPPPDRILKKLGKAEQTVQDFCRHIIDGRPFFKGKHGYILGVMQRGPYRLFYSAFQDLLSVDPDRCTGCGRCAKLCPMDNIVMTDNLPVFQKRCALCLRCYNFCPELAVKYKNRLHDAMKQGTPYQGPDKKFKPEQLLKP